MVIKNKILSIILGLVLLAVTVPTAVSATLTSDQIQSIINLLASFGADSATINNVRVSLNGGTPSITGGWCYTFNSNLGQANSGSNDVMNLHTVLQKEGIFYGSDDVGAFSIGTTNAVKQFQTKYGISPQSGYVGPLTRTKLNQLYGCVVIPTCQPSWQIGAWSLCSNGSQTRSVADYNNCGTQLNQPTTIQSCAQKPGVVIQANNSDGPVNLFLTLGSGASVNSSGITLTKDTNLQWSGLNVASCVASDSLTPTVFSGYKPYFGSQTVTFSGILKNVSASNNKISDTFRINCIETTTGHSVTDSVTVNLFYNVNSNCYTNWQCTEWTNCVSSRQTRTCTDWNGCGSLAGKPIETQSCTVPPTINLKINGSNGPVTIASGSIPTLSWTSSGASSCTASGSEWSGPKPVSGSEKINTVTSAEVFMMSCTNAGGTSTDSVAVNITN